MTASFPTEPSLFGQAGELISLSVRTDPKLLEDLLEALALLDFPVNPQLYHQPADVLVEFPAYSTQVAQVRAILVREGFNPDSILVSRPLARARAKGA